MMRLLSDGASVRLTGGALGHEYAYAKFGLSGLCAEIEFPSDWHDRRAAWVRLGFGIGRVGFSFPWPWTVPDEHQCSGPTYGFSFFDDVLLLHWGKSKGKRSDPLKVIHMPWHWKHREHRVLSDFEKHDYRYTLRSGEVQRRTAKIRVEARRWTRFWWPRTMNRRYIEIEFDDEVGERSGSWKGGVMGCSYDMLPHESPAECLRRMERERKL